MSICSKGKQWDRNITSHGGLPAVHFRTLLTRQHFWHIFSFKMPKIFVVSIIFFGLISTILSHPVVPSIDTIYDLEKLSTKFQLFRTKMVDATTTDHAPAKHMSKSPKMAENLRQDKFETLVNAEVRKTGSESLPVTIGKLKSPKRTSRPKSDAENMSEMLRKYVRLWWRFKAFLFFNFKMY